MKKSIFSLVAIVAAVVLLVSCSGGADGSDPKAVLKAFFEHLSKKDVDGAAKYATSDSKSTLDMMKKALDAAKTMSDSAGNDDPTKSFKDVTFGEPKIDGDNATVSVTGKNQPTADFNLKKEEGKWKVDFSMSTLMKMGQKAAGEMQHGADDGHNHGDLNAGDSGINLNSEEMQKGKEMADSILKNIDPKDIEKMQKQIEEATKK